RPRAGGHADRLRRRHRQRRGHPAPPLRVPPRRWRRGQPLPVPAPRLRLTPRRGPPTSTPLRPCGAVDNPARGRTVPTPSHHRHHPSRRLVAAAVDPHGGAGTRTIPPAGAAPRPTSSSLEVKVLAA